MAISYVGGKGAGAAGQGGGSISLTTGLTGGSGGAPIEGDLVVVTVSVGTAARAPTLAISTPSGYTALTVQRTTATTYDTNVQTCYKVMGSTPDTAVTIPASGNNADGISYAIQVFRGVDQTTPMDATPTYASGSGTNSRPNPAAITPVTAGAWIVVCGGGAAATGAAYTAAYLTNLITNFGADTNDALIGCGYYTGWTSGAYDPAVFGGGSATVNDSWGATTLALRPAEELTVVGEDLAGSYALVSAAGQDLAGSYGVIATTGQDLGSSYAVLEAAGQDLAGSYAVVAPVGADLAGTYGMAGVVLSDLAGTYGIQATVGADLVGSAAVLSAAGADLGGAYAITSAAGQNLAGSYGVQAVVGQSLAGSYGLAGAVGADLAGGYAIVGGASAVGADLAGSYGVLGAAGQDLAGAYAVTAPSSAVAADLLGTYMLLGNVWADMVGGYVVQQSAAAQAAINRYYTQQSHAHMQMTASGEGGQALLRIARRSRTRGM